MALPWTTTIGREALRSRSLPSRSLIHVWQNENDLMTVTETKKSGLKAVTLIAAPNPVSQVLW